MRQNNSCTTKQRFTRTLKICRTINNANNDEEIIDDTATKVEKDIKEYCKKNIAKYAIPYEYEFRNSLPVTKVGKIDYKQFERK